jgi:hypothetical protein
MCPSHSSRSVLPPSLDTVFVELLCRPHPSIKASSVCTKWKPSRHEPVVLCCKAEDFLIEDLVFGEIYEVGRRGSSALAEVNRLRPGHVLEDFHHESALMGIRDEHLRNFRFYPKPDLYEHRSEEKQAAAVIKGSVA